MVEKTAAFRQRRAADTARWRERLHRGAAVYPVEDSCDEARSQKFGQSAMTKITDLRLERRWRRLRKPDGNCAHCERSADRLHPVGPIIVKVSSPDTDAAGESWIYEFCSWKCLGHWAAIEAGFVPPNYGADRERSMKTTRKTLGTTEHPEQADGSQFGG